MTVSLRNIAQTHYGIAGSFSAIHDVLPKLPHDVNYRTADGKVSLRLILTPPRPPDIVYFTPSQLSVPQDNRKVTLSWKVWVYGDWLVMNTFVEIHERSSSSDVHWRVGLWDQKDFIVPPFGASYELVAYVHVPRGKTDPKKEKVTVKVELPPQAVGYPSVRIWNCAKDFGGHPIPVGIWSRDETAGGGWQRHGTIQPQYNNYGTCGPPDPPSDVSVSLISGHRYILIATNLNVGDDPSNGSCHTDMLPIRGGTTPNPYPWTVAGTH